jgi:hypothetical protein
MICGQEIMLRKSASTRRVVVSGRPFGRLVDDLATFFNFYRSAFNGL